MRIGDPESGHDEGQAHEGPVQSHIKHLATRRAVSTVSASAMTPNPPVRVIPNASLQKEAFMRYASEPVATLVPPTSPRKPRRRKIAALPKRHVAVPLPSQESAEVLQAWDSMP